MKLLAKGYLRKSENFVMRICNNRVSILADVKENQSQAPLSG
jgi:hypothetical protein